MLGTKVFGDSQGLESCLYTVFFIWEAAEAARMVQY